MRKKALSPAARREHVRRLTEAGVCSIRAGCRMLKLARSTWRYRGKAPSERQKALHRRLAELSARHPRYGYRRIAALLRQEGWAALPVTFGAAAIGRVEPADGSVLLKGLAEGQYSLMLKGAGQKTVRLELLAAVQTSPENRSFTIQCPPTGIADLTVSIPEPDQSVTIAPLQVLLPADGAMPEGAVAAQALLDVDAVGAFGRVDARAGTTIGGSMAQLLGVDSLADVGTALTLSGAHASDCLLIS